jgi:hypothetical protein
MIAVAELGERAVNRHSHVDGRDASTGDDEGVAARN